MNLFGFSFNDQVNNYMSLSDFGWNSFGGGTNFLVIPGKSPVMIEGNIAYSSYTSRMKEVDNPDRYSKINGFNMGFDFSQFMGKHTLKYGVEMLGYTTDYETYSLYGGNKIAQKVNSTEIGAYAKFKAVLGDFLLEPSLRLQWYASLLWQRVPSLRRVILLPISCQLLRRIKLSSSTMLMTIGILMSAFLSLLPTILQKTSMKTRLS